MTFWRSVRVASTTWTTWPWISLRGGRSGRRRCGRVYGVAGRNRTSRRLLSGDLAIRGRTPRPRPTQRARGSSVATTTASRRGSPAAAGHPADRPAARPARSAADRRAERRRPLARAPAEGGHDRLAGAQPEQVRALGARSRPAAPGPSSPAGSTRSARPRTTANGRPAQLAGGQLGRARPARRRRPARSPPACCRRGRRGRRGRRAPGARRRRSRCRSGPRARRGRRCR